MADLLVRISNWVDPIADYKFTDIDSDGTEEIITVQRVIGISHPDTIAELRTTYKLESGQYRPITEALTTPGDPVTGAVRVLSEIPDSSQSAGFGKLQAQAWVYWSFHSCCSQP